MASTQFDRWKVKNPNGTLEQFTQALAVFNKTKTFVAPPNLIPLPTGGYASAVGMSRSDCANITKEFVQNNYGSQ